MDTEKEIETQSLLKNKITKLEKDFANAKVETIANEVTDNEKLNQIFSFLSSSELLGSLKDEPSGNTIVGTTLFPLFKDLTSS